MRRYPTALMLLLVFPNLSARAQQAYTREEAYEQCMAFHFAVPGVTSNEDRGSATMVTLRALQGNCSREVQATLARPYEAGGAISVTLIKPMNENSVLEQLEELEARYPDRSHDELCREIEIKRETLRLETDHPLVERLRELELLAISPMPPGDVVLDGNRYLVQIWSGFGEAAFIFYGSGEMKDPAMTPLEKWILQVFNELRLSCVSPQAASSSRSRPG